MERPNAGSNNFVVGLFVAISLLVGTGFIVFMGGSSIFGSEMPVITHFDDVKGLNIGAPAFLSGIQVGRVSEIEFPKGAPAEGEPAQIKVRINVFSQYREQVRKDSEASISTQGVLGDKVMMISPGTWGSGALGDNGVITSKKEKELSDYFAKGANVVEGASELIHNLNVLVKDMNQSGRMKNVMANLEKASQQFATSSKDDIGPAMKSLRAILAKVEKGDGTLGALVNDSSLHEDLRVLLGGAKRSTVVRFLVRQAIANKDKEAESKEKKK